jgi:hypothetical protein
VNDFSRQPTSGERALGIVLSAVVLLVFGTLAIVFSLSGEAAASGVAITVSAIAAAIFWRACFSAPRALSKGSTYFLSWALLLAGVAGASLGFFVDGDRTDKLLALVGASTMLSAGLAGVRVRRQDA